MYFMNEKVSLVFFYDFIESFQKGVIVLFA